MAMKKWGLIGFVFLLIVINFFTPIRKYVSLQQLQGFLDRLGIIAPLIFGLIYVGACLLALPGSALTLLGGFLFGTFWGTIINLISATLGASLAFAFSRYLGRDYVERFLKGRLASSRLASQRLSKIEVHGFWTVFYLRLIPLFPFNLLNFGLGLTKIRFVDYFFATLIGMIPACFAYTSLGNSVTLITQTGKIDYTDIRLWGPIVLVLGLSLFVQFAKKRKR